MLRLRSIYLVLLFQYVGKVPAPLSLIPTNCIVDIVQHVRHHQLLLRTGGQADSGLHRETASSGAEHALRPHCVFELPNGLNMRIGRPESGIHRVH